MLSADSKVIGITRNGNRLTYTYNMYHSLTSRRSEKGDISERFGYYPDGKLRYAIGGGMRYDYTYDCMGRLTGKSAGGRALLSYTYDPDGNRTGLTDPTGKRTEYAYDYAGRLMEVRDNGKRQARYTYNPDGTISTLEIGDCGGEGVLYTEYSYDKDKNLTSLKTLIRQGAMGGAYGRLTDNHYSYDMAGNCIMKQTPAGETHYRYDSLYQLTEAVYPQGRREQFTYDRAGNRLTRTTQDIREEYSHDAAGRLTKRSVYEMLKDTKLPNTAQKVAEPKTYHYEYDRQGNTLSDGENTYRYDSLNRIVEVRTKNGDIQKNHYDGEGLRAELEENGRLVSFIFDNDKVISETDADQNTIRYIRGYELISSDSEKAKTYYHYASDELGSTTHLTDENGNVYNYYEYDAFGNFLTKAENVPNRFCFTGEQYDPVSQLYYLRARFYSPAIGRFIQEDTYYGDGLNLYAYCHNNPVGYVDPSGHAKTKKQTPINDMKYDDIKKELEDYYADFVKEKRKNIPTTSKDLLPNELFYDHFGDLPNEVGDNLTGHHMPADSYMAQYQKDRNKSYAMFFEQPGKGGRHRRTFTYGRTDGGRAKQLYNALTPRDALAFDLRDMRRILNEDIAGVTDFKLRKALRERINQQMKDYINAYKNDENFKELFDKNSIYNQIAPCGRRKYRG